MNHLIEYIGGDGIVTTDLRFFERRLNTPRPGDVVDFSKMNGVYPYHMGQYGTIDAVGNDGRFCKDGEAHICSHMGSIFLSREGVLISGGPFSTVKLNKLSWNGEFRIQRMWNWGNNGAGPDCGVYYNIERPVFVLEP